MMNEIQRALYDIAQQEIPDDMKSLWPALQAQLSTDPPRRTRATRRLAWGSLIVTLSLVISVAAYAFYQGGRHRDPGLTWVAENHLITPIDQSVSLDGITVTLDWAYADANRIALAYTATHADTGNNIGFTTDGWGHAACLSDGSGTEIPGPSTTDSPSNPFFIEADETYDASVIQGDPTSLTLHYQLWLGVSPIPPTPTPSPTNDQSAGGGGGGGGGGGMMECGDPAWLQQIAGEPVGPFTFDFTVPFFAAVTVTPQSAVTTYGTTLTLEQVSYTPSMTSVRVCFDKPDQGEFWAALGTLNTGQQVIDLNGVIGAHDQPANGRRCSLLQFPAPYDRQPAHWTLTITHLEAPLNVTPDNFEEMKTLFAQYGLTIEVTLETPNGFGWSMTPAEGVDVETVMHTIKADTGLWVDGPWVFTLDVPGSQP